MRDFRGRARRLAVVVAWAVALGGCARAPGRLPEDEAKQAGLTARDFPAHRADAFAGMDYPIVPGAARPDRYDPTHLTAEEIQGRNTWLMWTAGNQAFWDDMAQESNGVIDLLKLVDARHVAQWDRFRQLGVIPEPGLRQAEAYAEIEAHYRGLGVDPRGLWLDGPAAGSDPGPGGGRPDPKFYGYSSGIVGLRLLPNPRFRPAAWDARRHLEDDDYFTDPALSAPSGSGWPAPSTTSR